MSGVEKVALKPPAAAVSKLRVFEGLVGCGAHESFLRNHSSLKYVW
jgi:hypothetical protein